jgi:hypothetical protein
MKIEWTDDETATDTLGDALPREMARVRDEVLPAYDEIPSGAIAAQMMRHDLDLAIKALAEGNVIEIMRAYEAMKGWQL